MVMTNTTADTEYEKNTISGFTTLDEMDGTNNARKTITTPALTEVTGAAGYVKLTGDNQTWTALGAGTRQVQAVLIYKHVTNDTDSVPIAYIDTGGFPFTANGGDVTITWHANGILQVA